MDLLPTSYEQFRSKEYWAEFFRKRSSGFEWYGEWPDLRRVFNATASKDAKVLNIGCGNSALSADMYDSGIPDITNIDFSKEVIDAMAKKDAHRKGMTYLEMDMLHTSFEADSFDVVMDKGAADALIAEDNKECLADGRQLCKEVGRVLKPQGVYICVTLAQTHVLRCLLSSMIMGWEVTVQLLHPKQPASLPAFVIVAKKLAAAATPSSFFTMEPRVGLIEVPHAASAASEQRQEHRGIAQMLQAVQDIQWYYYVGKRLSRVTPGLYLNLDLYLGSSSSGEESKDSGSNAALEPRYKVQIIDLRSQKSAAVVLVPAGWEASWRFSTEEGLKRLGEDVPGVGRLIAVAFGRGHSFGSVQSVQGELSPSIRGLVPGNIRSIPFMMPAGLGERKLVASITSKLSGVMFIEDVKVESEDDEEGEEDGKEDMPLMRRLVFQHSPTVIQSEMRSVAAVAAPTSAASLHVSLLPPSPPPAPPAPPIAPSPLVQCVVLCFAQTPSIEPF